jgi:FixJ family two-component response regulator
MDGLKLQDALRQRPNRQASYFSLLLEASPASVKAMRQDTEDSLPKDTPKAKIVDAVTRAIERDGERERATEIKGKFALLTERDHEVLGEVVQGKLIN